MKRLVTFLLAAALLAGICGCSGGDDKGAAIPVPELRCATAVDRQETLSVLRDAWANRTTEATHEGKRAEIGFLSTLAAFLKKTRGTETHADATAFWKECVKAHNKRFP